jgi:hypothetical protein
VAHLDASVNACLDEQGAVLVDDSTKLQGASRVIKPKYAGVANAIGAGKHLNRCIYSHIYITHSYGTRLRLC